MTKLLNCPVTDVKGASALIAGLRCTKVESRRGKRREKTGKHRQLACAYLCEYYEMLFTMSKQDCGSRQPVDLCRTKTKQPVSSDVLLS